MSTEKEIAEKYLNLTKDALISGNFKLAHVYCRKLLHTICKLANDAIPCTVVDPHRREVANAHNG